MLLVRGETEVGQRATPTLAASLLMQASELQAENKKAIEVVCQPVGDAPAVSGGTYASTHWVQLRALLRRQALRYWRLPLYNGIRLVLSLAFALILGSLYYSQGQVCDVGSLLTVGGCDAGRELERILCVHSVGAGPRRQRQHDQRVKYNGNAFYGHFVPRRRQLELCHCGVRRGAYGAVPRARRGHVLELSVRRRRGPGERAPGWLGAGGMGWAGRVEVILSLQGLSPRRHTSPRPVQVELPYLAVMVLIFVPITYFMIGERVRYKNDCNPLPLLPAKCA